MRDRRTRLMMLVLLVLLSISAVMVVGRAQKSENGTSPQIPKTWDDKAVAELEVPLADPRYSPVHVSSDYYYRMPVRQIYKSYPIYAPGKEPPGYMEWLKQQEPEIVFDASDRFDGITARGLYLRTVSKGNFWFIRRRRAFFHNRICFQAFERSTN